MAGENKTPNYFVRILIGALSLLLTAMIIYRFVAIAPKGEISVGIITLLCMLIVLVLAESFDSFSIGKLMSISREVEKKNKQVEKLEQEKIGLYSQLISMTQNQNQNQTSTNVFTSPVTVSKATEKEIEEKRLMKSMREQWLSKRMLHHKLW